MEKLRLTIDELRVESFATGAGRLTRGTVRAESDTGLYCEVATVAGNTCESTQLQIICGCTAGQTACDSLCGPTHNYEPTCQVEAGCPDYTHDAHCVTNAGYIGC